ncbi:MAG: extracellular solute-binding protein [Phycisphaerae bacterium]
MSLRSPQPAPASPASPRRRRFVAASLAVAASLLLSPGCGRPPAFEGVTLELWTLALSPHFDGYMREQVAAFEASHPGVRVTWVDIAYDALDRKLIAAAAAGRAPDVVNMADLNFARYAALGAFRDVRGDLPGDPATAYLPGAIALCAIGGRLLSLPWYVNPQTRIVNKAVLAEGGLTPESLPADWLGLAAAAKAFHAKTGKHLFSQPLGEESQLPIMLLAEGLPPLRARADGRLESNLDDPKVQAYLATWVDLYRAGAMPRDAATRGHAHLLDLFQEGKLGVISTGPNFLKRIRDVSPRVFEQATVMPGAVGSLGRVHMPVMVLAVSNRTRHPREAAELAWFMTAAASQTALCRLAPIMPSSSASLDDPFFQPGRPATAGEATLALGTSVALRTLPEAVAFTASLDTWPDLRRSFEEEFKRVLLDNAPLDEAMKRVARTWNSLLDAAAPAGIDCVPTPAKVAPPAWRTPAEEALTR